MISCPSDVLVASEALYTVVNSCIDLLVLQNLKIGFAQSTFQLPSELNF
jgi:hypothetical protein